MAYNVLLAASAERDLDEIFLHIQENDGKETAKVITERIANTLRTLEKMPARGGIVQEMAKLGYTTFRQLHEGPYRIIYTVFANDVVVIAILDGRRDVQTLLLQRQR